MEVPESYQARIGDRFDFHYSVSGFGKRGQIESLVREADKDPRWKVEQYEYDENTGKLRLRFKIIQNPLPLIIIVAAIGGIGIGLFAWLSLDKVEKIVSDPIGGLAVLGTVIGGLMVLRKV
ncbi:MAG: hypothetical protein HWN68_16605 [Desulfobacterales bacterium]|nr:hypothetical protein [Desulfobacterales bacterium]